MKTLELSNIVEPIRKLGATGVTLAHMMEAIKETTANIIKGIGVDPSGVVVLYGCVNSGSGLNFDISAGACYYQGEIYEVDALVGTAGGGQTAVISITTLARSGDPVLYSDGNSYQTHVIRKMQWSFAVSGSGLADYSEVISIKDRVNSNLLDVPGQLASTLATANAYSDSLVVGLWDDRGNYNPATNSNLYPSIGGSGIAGAVKKGDIWTINGLGLGIVTTIGTQNVQDRDVVRALQDTPGQTESNWAIVEANLSYVPVNKTGDSMSGPLVNSSTGEFAGGIRTLSSGAYLIKKIVSIGSWNMYFSGGGGVDNKSVAHGLGANFNKIRSISVMIIDDDGAIIRPLPTIDGVTNDLVGGIGNIDNTNIVLFALGASSINYNNNNYDGAGNRGWITIEYEA